MKNIQAQYQDLLEGKMSKANFMVNVRRDFPQWVSSTNSFQDAVSILKNKRILSESMGENPATLGVAQDEFDASQQDTDNGSWDSETISEASDISPEAIEVALHTMFDDGLIDDITWKSASKALPNFNIEDHMSMAGNDTPEDLAKELIFIVTGEHVEDMQGYDGDGEDPGFDDWRMGMRGLNEAVEKPIGVYGHNPNAEAPTEIGYDHVNYHQLMKGMEFELAKAKEITDEALVKAKQAALKNIKKDKNYYRDLIVANVKAVDKMDQTLKMVPVKSDNMVDKANAMKEIKKDVKGNVQDNLGKKEKAKSKNGEGIKQMTQTPKKAKGIAQTMEVPGKEKVMALKEHLLDELTKENPHKEDIRKGRVKKKDGSRTGEVIEVDNDTATVEWDDAPGKKEHVQLNVLTHKEVADKQEKPVEDKQTKLAKLKEKLMKFVKKEMGEGAVAQTSSGVTVASGTNPGDVAKRAMDLKKQTGDSFTVLDTKAGTRRKI